MTPPIDPDHVPIDMDFGSGFHAPVGRPVDAAAYDGYIGRWSRLFVQALLSAAEVSAGDRVLDLAAGSGEAARMALPIVQTSGCVIGADLSPAMLDAARIRLGRRSFLAVAADGQALPFRDASFDAVVCQLGLQFFPDPATGLTESLRVLRFGRRVAVCVVANADRAPIWGVLADALSRHLPARRKAPHLSFSLADAGLLERLLRAAGFHEIQVKSETRVAVVESFEAYWACVEAGTGLAPQAYLTLPQAIRRSVREEVWAGLSKFASDGRLAMEIEMLIGSGRA